MRELTRNEVCQISQKRARALAIKSSRLQEVAPFGKGEMSLVKAIGHLGYVQIDTISVIQRAHHHVIWSRIPTYKLRDLHDHQAEKRTIFEYWSHAAAYLPMEDFRFTSFTKKYFRSWQDPWPKPDKKLMGLVLKRIEAEGALMARDFVGTGDKTNTGWWDWKPAKRALERLFLDGRLMVSERRGFQKVYEIPERVIPANLDVSEPSSDEYADYLIDRFLQAQGLGSLKQICHLRRGVRDSVRERIKHRMEEDLIALDVEGCEGVQYFTKVEYLQKNHRIQKRISILSPFDNFTIQRERLKDLFQYDYSIECYLPVSKRQYGYFCLPLLYGDRFIGRLDAKANRKAKTLIIRNLVLEEDFESRSMPDSVWVESLHRFAAFNGCADIGLDEHSNPTIRGMLPFL